MSWGQWPGAQAQQPPVVATAAPLLNPATNVMPPGMPYNSDQWSQMQQQNWQQWAQWQQQYQQWHQQYGAEYQKSINALAAQQTVVSNVDAPPPLPVDPQPQPPLPQEESPKPAPPLPVPVPPPQQAVGLQYSTQPLLPSQFSAPPPSFAPNIAQQSWKANSNIEQKRQLVGSDESIAKRQMTNRQGWHNTSVPPPVPNQKEELSEAEKKFDKQFAEWETQFNKWKDQNSGHPDKEQYREYEKKWEQWRQQLLDRREAMRRKRLGLPPAKPLQTSNFNIPPPSQAANAQAPMQSLSGVGQSKDIGNPSIFTKPPPDMNNEPLKFKNNDKESEPIEDGPGFLSAAKSVGIPGLDLVKEGEVDDIVDEEPNPHRGPDLEAISKGINNILGDQKLMNMLSMVSQNQGANLNNFSHIGGDASSSHDQSNMSIEDTRNEIPEPIQNFDDQTRSSFTLQPNDTECYRSPMNNSQIGRRAQPLNYHDKESLYSRPPPNFAMPSDDDLKRPPPVKFASDLDNGSFALKNPGTFDRMPPMIQDSFGHRGSTPFSDPDRKGGVLVGKSSRGLFGHETMTRVREPFDPGNDRDGFRTRDGPANGPDANRGNFGLRGRPEFELENSNKNVFGSRIPLNRDCQGRNNIANSYDHHFGDNRRELFDKPHPSAYDRDGRLPQNQSFGLGSRGGMDESNDQTTSNFRGGRDNYNEPPPQNFRGGRDDFNEPPPQNFRGGRDDFNEPPPQNFRGRNNDFRQNDRTFQRGGNFAPDRDDCFDEYANERSVPNKGPGTAMFDRSGGRFGNDMDPNYGQGNFVDESDYPPPPMIRGSFGPNDNIGSMDNAPEPPQFSREMFGEERFDEMPPDEYLEAPALDDIWKPATVLDYEHKRLKPPEIDILVQPFRMFDYRHNPLRRIPYPERPNWLSDSVKMIPEFDPPIIRQPAIERRMYDERYEPMISRRDDRNNFRNDERHKYERKGYDTRFSPSPLPKYEEDDWSSRRRRSRSPPRFEKPPFGGVREGDAWDKSARISERDRRGEKRRWEDDDTFRRDRNFDREKRDDRRERRDERDRGDDGSWKRRDTEWDDNRKWRNHDMEYDMELDMVDKDKKDARFKIDNRNDEPSNPSNRREGDSVFPFSKPIDENKSVNVTPIDELLNAPGRLKRPQRIVIILRGPPGSGKTHLAKMIKDKEVENGGSTPRILSLEDYFMVEQEREVIEDGKWIKLKEMVYEFEAEMEESYRTSLMRSFKKTITDGYFPFIIVDDVNDKVKYFGEMWSFAKQNGFQVYICQLDLDIQNCTRRNIHNRIEEEIRLCIEGWENTPSHHPTLDATPLLQGESIPEVEMEEISSPVSDVDEKDGSEEPLDRSKWDNFDCSINNLARLDGVSKPPRPSRTMEEFLQLDDEWEITRPTKQGEKRVRWADLEERKQQEKMRAIGFVVGQTDWDRMMDPMMGQGALTQTKYIEKVQRKRF